MTSRLTPVQALLRHQAGVATMQQLAGAGMTEHEVRAHVAGRRWQRRGGHCIVAHNFEPTRLQWMWLAVLDNPGHAALAGLSALELKGFRFFGTEMDRVHVVVPRGATYHPFPDVQVHESRRLHPADIVLGRGVPHLRVARSALDAGAWQPYPRYAGAVLAAVVQQRLCTVADLSDQLERVGRIRHKKHMRLAVLDIAGGAEALSEIDVAALCRRFGLEQPHRQRVRRDRHGRKRYLDCEWRLSDGRLVVLEVDGSHHLEVEHWEADIKRERGVVIDGRSVLRCTANEARLDQRAIADDLAAIGIPRC